MYILESLFLGLLVCALINVPLVLRAKRLRRLAQAKLGIIKSVAEFEGRLLDGTVKNGDACHDVLFRAMTHVQNRESYRVPWNPFRFPSKKERECHKMLHKELEAKDDVAEILRDFSNWYSRAYRTKNPGSSIVFALWVFAWGTSFKIVALGLMGFIFSVVRIQKMVSSYRTLKKPSMNGFLQERCVWGIKR